MSISRIDALVDAFAAMNGCLDPHRDAYRLRNPLMLPAFSDKYTKDPKTGKRVFNSWSSGFDNSKIDVKIKASGASLSKIGPTSTLLDLTCLYGNPKTAVDYIVNFLRHALQDETITKNIQLQWFLESPQENKEII
jgi:hypothetical protein